MCMYHRHSVYASVCHTHTYLHTSVTQKKNVWETTWFCFSILCLENNNNNKRTTRTCRQEQNKSKLKGPIEHQSDFFLLEFKLSGDSVIAFFLLFFSASFILGRKFRSPYLGTATAATRAVLPIPNSACSYFCVSKQRYGCQCLGSLTCTQKLMNAIAHGGCMDTITLSKNFCMSIFTTFQGEQKKIFFFFF